MYRTPVSFAVMCENQRKDKQSKGDVKIKVGNEEGRDDEGQGREEGTTEGEGRMDMAKSPNTTCHHETHSFAQRMCVCW